MYVVTHYWHAGADPDGWTELRYLAKLYGETDAPSIVYPREYTILPEVVREQEAKGVIIRLQLPLIISALQHLWLSPQGELCVSPKPLRLPDELSPPLQLAPLSMPTERPVSLKELRTMSHVTQSEMATALSTQQTAVSRYEGQSDVRTNTLRKFFKILGAELELVAKFKDRSFRIVLGTSRSTRRVRKS
jgi:DNA-binding XRE family transcriptional regulator